MTRFTSMCFPRPLLALALMTVPLPLLAQPACTKPDSGALFKVYAAKEHPGKYSDDPKEKERMDASDIAGYAETIDDFDLKSPHLQRDTPLVQWIALDFGSTSDGGLLAADCKGGYIDLLRIGPVEELKPGPTLPKLGRTVMVDTDV